MISSTGFGFIIIGILVGFLTILSIISIVMASSSSSKKKLGIFAEYDNIIPGSSSTYSDKIPSVTNIVDTEVTYGTFDLTKYNTVHKIGTSFNIDESNGKMTYTGPNSTTFQYNVYASLTATFTGNAWASPYVIKREFLTGSTYGISTYFIQPLQTTADTNLLTNGVTTLKPGDSLYFGIIRDVTATGFSAEVKGLNIFIQEF